MLWMLSFTPAVWASTNGMSLPILIGAAAADCGVCARPRGAPISQSEKWKHLCRCWDQGVADWRETVSVPLNQPQIGIQHQGMQWTMNSVFSTQHTWSPGLHFRPNLKPLTSTQSSYVHHLWIIWPIYMSWFIPNLYRKPNLSSSSDRVYGAEQHSERSSSLPLIWRKQNKRRHIRVCQHASG